MSVASSTMASIRFGYGFRPGEPVPHGASDLISRLAQPDENPLSFSPWTLDEATAAFLAFRKAQVARRENRRGAEEDHSRAVTALREQGSMTVKSVFGRAVFGRDGFRERLVAFWRDHFTVVAKSVQMGGFLGDLNDVAIRRHVTGKFANLLTAAITHPAMLFYLDQNASAGSRSLRAQRGKGGLNENLARELLELHTMGAGGAYGQADVRQLAELMAGMRYSENGLKMTGSWAQPGTKTVLGKTYSGPVPELDDVRAFLSDVALHPDTGRHLARKLAVHFVSDTPDEGLVAHLSEAYRATGGDLMAVYAALLEHPDSWREFGAKAKQPFDLVVSGLRALDLPQQMLEQADARAVRRYLQGPVTLMGQPLFRANGPDGWPEAAAEWITPQGLAGRLRWAGDTARSFGTGRDPRAFLDTALADAAGAALRWAAPRAESREAGLALILASPEFNRR